MQNIYELINHWMVVYFKSLAVFCILLTIAHLIFPKFFYGIKMKGINWLKEKNLDAFVIIEKDLAFKSYVRNLWYLLVFFIIAAGLIFYFLK